MKKSIKIFIIVFCLFSFKSFAAQIVDNIIREETKFGDWTIACEEDIMMGKIDCRIFSHFYNNTSAIYVQPNNKIANQVVIIIPAALEKTNVKFRVDRKSLIISETMEKSPEFGVIPFTPTKQKQMLTQLKDGENLFIRFTVRDLQVAGGIREITAKISLVEFSKLLVYYESRMGHSGQ
jgi:hypothetical protein